MSEPIGKLLEAAQSGFERHEIVARDGARLVTYSVGPKGAPLVAIINPVGVPIVISSRLATCLADQYRVLCWEQRGFGAGFEQFCRQPHDFSAYVEDIHAVVAASGGAVAVLIGICSGAALAIRAVATGLVRPTASLLVCPSVRFSEGYTPSLFDSALVPYMRMISAGNWPLARELLDMRAAFLHEPRPQPPGVDEQVIEAADTVSLQSLEALLVYANTIKVFSEQLLDADLPAVTGKVVLFAMRDDRTVSIHSTRKLATLLPDAELREYATGGHFAVFVREDVRQDIRRVVDESVLGAR